MDDLLAYLTHNCCQGDVCLPKTAKAEQHFAAPSPGTCIDHIERKAVSEGIHNVLFLCTGDSARSIPTESSLSLRSVRGVPGHARRHCSATRNRQHRQTAPAGPMTLVTGESCHRSAEKFMNSPKTVLILCTGNSCRSQMAEALVNHDLHGQVRALSAGTRPQLNVAARAIEALSQAGLPTDGLYPKDVEAVLDEPIDLVVTVCDNAKEACPIFPARGAAHPPAVP